MLLLQSLECWGCRRMPPPLASCLVLSHPLVVFLLGRLSGGEYWLVGFRTHRFEPTTDPLPSALAGAGLAQLQPWFSAGLQYLPSASSYEFCQCRSIAVPRIPSALSWLPTTPRGSTYPPWYLGCGSTSPTGFVVNVSDWWLALSFSFLLHSSVQFRW